MPPYVVKLIRRSRIKTTAKATLPVVALGGTGSGGTINVYINNQLSQTITSTNLNLEVVNIEM